MQVELIIRLTDQGQVEVRGPIDQKLLMYGMIGCALDAIREHERQNQRLVQPATAGYIPQ